MDDSRTPAGLPAGLRDELLAALGPDGLHLDPVDLALHAGDSSLLRGRAGGVCFPESPEQVAAVVRAAHRHAHPVVARGAGTGLAGGAVPLDDALVVVTTRLDAVETIDVANRVAWVQPGAINLDLDRMLRPLGWHFAPDPSSQQACTIGGNVATNSGGPHCLAYGVTNAHVAATEVVLGDGSTVLLGGIDPEPVGLDLRGAFVGSEGTLGIVTEVTLRLLPAQHTSSVVVASFGSVQAAMDA
ncbi:MAG: FAD-binding oxidoreductase, partial [Acidimicrobiales bacterium]